MSVRVPSRPIRTETKALFPQKARELVAGESERLR
jgi:hypothetical protein